MLKRLFRIAIILIILLWISNYTQVLNNTKIKPYLNNVTLVLQNQVENIKWWFGSGDKEIIEEVVVETGEVTSVTWASNFGEEDILGGNMAINDQKDNEVVNIVEDASNSGVKKILNFQIKNCVSPWGKFIPKNGYIVAYESRSSAECKWEKRYCNNGDLDWTYLHDTCFYSTTIQKQQSESALSKSEIQDMQKEYGLVEVKQTIPSASEEDISAWEEAGPGVVLSSSRLTETVPDLSETASQANTLKSSNNDPDKHFEGRPTKSINILANGQTEINNHKLKTWSLKKQVQWYIWETFITGKKSINSKNSYDRKVCYTPWWTVISNGHFVTAFKSTSAENGICELETRFCIDWSLQWSYYNAQCEWGFPALINTPQWLDLANNAIIVWYSETRNVIKSKLVDLDPMSIPSDSPSSYEIYHQPNEEDSFSNSEFHFVPINNNEVYTESEIVVNPGFVIHHQDDEVSY